MKIKSLCLLLTDLFTRKCRINYWSLFYSPNNSAQWNLLLVWNSTDYTRTRVENYIILMKVLCLRFFPSHYPTDDKVHIATGRKRSGYQRHTHTDKHRGLKLETKDSSVPGCPCVYNVCMCVCASLAFNRHFSRRCFKRTKCLWGPTINCDDWNDSMGWKRLRFIGHNEAIIGNWNLLLLITCSIESSVEYEFTKKRG